MGMYLKGKLIDENFILSDAQALPNATTGYTTNAIDLGIVSNIPSATYPSAAGSNGSLLITVVAHTEVEVAGGASLTITPCFGTTSTPTTQYGNRFVCTQGTDTPATWAVGTIITQFIVPQDTLAAGTRYLRLLYTTSADESLDTVDAFVSILV